MHKSLHPSFEALQLNKAAKVHDAANFALVYTTLLRLVQQGCWWRSVASRALPMPCRAWLWAVAAPPLGATIPVSASAAMLPLSVPVPVSFSIWTVPVTTRSSVTVIICIPVAAFLCMAIC